MFVGTLPVLDWALADAGAEHSGAADSGGGGGTVAVACALERWP